LYCFYTTTTQPVLQIITYSKIRIAIFAVQHTFAMVIDELNPDIIVAIILGLIDVITIAAVIIVVICRRCQANKQNI